MADPYDLRSNIKNKPGSQGTLFQVKDKGLLNPAQRWPQGYTPERLNEVREATKPIGIRAPGFLDNETTDPQLEDAAYGNRDRVQKVIARSTIPVEHLKGLREIHGNPDTDDAGTYWPQRKTIGVNMTGIADRDNEDAVHESREEAARTLIHEIGHHVHNDGTTSHGSWEASEAIRAAGQKHAETQLAKDQKERPYTPLSMNRTRQAMGENAVQAGVHEALADNYYVEHYRGPGKPGKGARAETGHYEDNFTTEARDKSYPGYNDVRPSPYLNTKQFAKPDPEIPGLETKVVPNATGPGYRRKFAGA